jgi:hypothetical protein
VRSLSGVRVEAEVDELGERLLVSEHFLPAAVVDHWLDSQVGH